MASTVVKPQCLVITAVYEVRMLRTRVKTRLSGRSRSSPWVKSLVKESSSPNKLQHCNVQAEVSGGVGGN